MFFQLLKVPGRPCALRRGRHLVIAALIVVATPALGQDAGRQAFESFANALKTLGLEVNHGPVSYDGSSDTVTVSDLALSLSGTIENLPAGGTDTAQQTGTTDLDYELSLTSGTLTMTGLSHSGRDFEVSEMRYSDDTQLVLSGSAEGEGRIRIDGRLAGTSFSDYRFTLPEFPAEDPQRLASRWLPFLRTSLQASFDTVGIDAIGFTIEAYGQDGPDETLAMSGTVQMDGLRMTDGANGRIRDYTIDSITQTLRTLEPGSGTMLAQETRQGKTIYSGLDYGPLVDLLDPQVPAGGEAKVLLGSASVIDYSARQDLVNGGEIETTIDRLSIDDITLTKHDVDLLALLDNVLAKNAPSPEELVTGAFQFYRSFGVGDARVSGIEIKVPTAATQPDIGLSIAEMAMSQINSDGIGEMLIVGVDAPTLTDGGAFRLDWAAIKDIEFADYTPMRAMISTLMADPDFGEEHPLDVMRAFLPRSFGYEIEGLDVTLPDVGRTQIDAAEMTVSTTVPPVPTSFHIKNTGIRVPVNAIEDAQAQTLLRALGLDTVVWSDETRLYWDEATLELRLDRLMLDIKGVGRAELSARFANVPRALFEDPETQGQMAMIVAQFVEASLTFRDGGLATKGVAHIAEAEGIPENVFREALVAQAAEATRPIGNPAFTGMVSDAVSEFLKNPGELKVTMKPAGPVPLAQILGSLAAPQTLPDLLNFSITAE
ncbi:MAG: hypothetical protein Tsb0019_03070 [Roseibium sp.]